MNKVLGSWSGMRKYLESEMIADSLKNKVRYGCTEYVGMDGCRIFELVLDGIQLKRFSWETVNSYFIERGYKNESNLAGIQKYWNEFWECMDKYPMEARTEYTDNEFAEALDFYRNRPIEESLESSNPIIKMFVLFDRRVGKRRLGLLKSKIYEEDDWLQKVYDFRVEAEKMNES